MQRSLPNCLTLGPNAAWQTVLCFDSLVIGDVNRATSKHSCPAGKGVNAARALRFAGLRPTVAQFAGGTTGAAICSVLARDGIPHITVETDAETRTATTVIDEGGRTVTELIEPSGTLSDETVAELLRRVVAVLPGFDGVALCGTWPPGVSASFYAEIARRARGRSVVLLDAWRDVVETLEAGVDILKINAKEITTFTGLPEPIAAARDCLSRFDVGFIVVTAGAAPTCVVGRDGAWRVPLPDLDGIRNPIGAGDCVAGTLLARMAALFCEQRTEDTAALADVVTIDEVVGAVTYALAAGPASCIDILPAHFDPALAERLYRETQPERAT